MKKQKVDLKTLTVHQKQMELRKQVAEEEEEIQTLGQESETKAVKWVKEVEKENMHAEDEDRAQEEWKLHDTRNQLFTYQKALLETCRRRMVEYDEFVPRGFMWIAKLNRDEEGLEIWIRTPLDKFFCKAMRISRLTQYDLNWVDNTIVYGLNQMDEIAKQIEIEQNNHNKVELIIDGKKKYL